MLTGHMADRTVLDVFRSEFTRDGARPFLTWYGDDGARVELSVATIERWIAKTANFLQDGLAAQPGDVAVVALPDHWLTPAIWWACWHNGIVVVPLDPAEDLPVDADILFVTADRAGEAAALARDVIAVSTAPMGGRIRGELAGGVADFGADVPGYDDRFAAYAPADGDAGALRFGGRTLSLREIVAGATAFAPSARVLTALAWHTSDGLLTVVGALAAGGGIVSGTTDPHAAATERVTVTVGVELPGIPRHDSDERHEGHSA
ncbi:MAG: acyl-CoA synthetase [Frankiales bacterium]|nr:acyl-CoA synthetase [Frankiales bacterium]